MQGNDFFLGQPGVLRHKGQVWAEIAAIADRNCNEPSLPCRSVRTVGVSQLFHGVGYGIVFRYKWVIRDEQRGKGGYCFHHAGELCGQHTAVQCRHRRTDVRRNALCKLCQQGAVPHRMQLKRQHGRRLLPYYIV